MKTVTKKDVSRLAANMIGEKVAVTEMVVDGVFNTIRDIMMNADSEVRIEIRDFGVFEVKRTKPKPRARNPRTGEIVKVPARRKTHFKPGKALKEMLREPLDE